MRVVITGAAGRIGRHVVDELSGSHDLQLIDRSRVSGHRTILADLGRGRPSGPWELPWRVLDLPLWERAFEGAQVIVHLAANPAPGAAWDAVLRQNIRATWNVFEAAARRRVPRVVFASSFAGTLGLRNARELGPDTVLATAPPRPRTTYGLSKAWGELAGRMFVDQGRLRSVLAVRIGLFRDQVPSDEQAQRWWIRPADVRSLLRRCVEAELEGFHVVNAISGTADGLIDLSTTRDLLDWQPGDSGA